MVGGKKDQCGVCRANVTKTQSSVQCIFCLMWYHAACVDIDDNEMDAIRTFKNWVYYCPTCKKNPPSSSDERTLRNEMTTLNSKFDSFLKKSDDMSSSIKKTIADVVADLKSEMSSGIKEIKSDVVACNRLINQVEASTLERIKFLEMENNALYKKFNRADLVINGLPSGLRSLSSAIVELGSYYKVPMNLSDLNHVCYINKQRAVLVKFNSVLVRDSIMSEYFKTIKTKPLKLPNIVTDSDAADIDKRIFLNDHYSPAAGKLNGLCRKLLKEKIIRKFKLINADKPVSVLTLTDGSEVRYDISKCTELLNNGVAAT